MIAKFKMIFLSMLFIVVPSTCVYSKHIDDKDKEPCNRYMSFSVKSFAFESGGRIPEKYVCSKIKGGENKSIPLVWTGAQTVTKSFAILMYDPHPVANNFIHWAVVNIPSDMNRVKEGASGTTAMPAGSIELINSSGSKGYIGPCPPKGTGKHEYKIIVYALSSGSVDLSGQVSLSQFQEAVKGKVISQAEITGYFEQ